MRSAALGHGRAFHVCAQQQLQKQKRKASRGRKKAAAKQAVPNASVEDANPERDEKKRVDERRMAATAKVSAAKSLARRLASEQETALAAAQLDEEELESIKRSAGETSATAAREAAKAAAKERQSRRRVPLASDQLAELARMKEENQALQRMVLELASNKQEARERLAGLKEDYNYLISELSKAQPLSNGALEAARKQAQAAANLAAQAPEKEAEIKQVVGSLSASKEALAQETQSPSNVKGMASKAAKEGRVVFYSPEEGVSINTPATLYYNSAPSPLPGGGRLQLKLGINKWQEIQHRDLQRAEELADVEGEWWKVDLSFEETVFKVDFVVMDPESQAVDNNRGQDYHLQLVDALLEEEILERQATMLAQMEEKRLQVMEAEEDRLWQQLREAAFKEADAARETFREQFEESMWADAAAKAAERRENLEGTGLALQEEWEGVLHWESPPEAGREAVLLYNKDSGALRHANGVLLHFGLDAWYKSNVTQVELSHVEQNQRKSLKLPEHGDWWRGSIQVPSTAQVVDFVLSDSDRRAWDNNKNRDYHVPVKKALSKEKLIQEFFSEAWRAGQEQLREGQDRAAKRVIRKMEEKAKATRKRRELQRQVFYTEPLSPEAGRACEVFYNPDITNLRGRPEIWIRGGYNRWGHPQTFGPLQMQPALRGGAGFYRATVEIPKDAWDVDFVLSDAGDSGRGSFYDNNGGMDYHFDVANSSLAAPPLNVFHIAVEMAPIAKVGGMADVVTALGRAVKEAGHNVKIIVPKYDVINYAEVRGIKQSGDFFFGGTQVKVWEGVVEDLDTIFLEPCNGTVWAGCIYGRNDDAARFGFFCGAASEFLKHHYDGPPPDIVHAHDWQSAPVVFGDVHPARSIFTIHNMEFGVDQIGRAVNGSAVATTVSPTYATEISGHPVIAPSLEKFYGIRNGIDQEIWDPLFDKALPTPYSHENVAEGKAAAKAELRRRMDLSSADVPLVSVVTRLTHQKGIHLIKHAAWRTLERGGQFVLLGSAPDPRVQGEFNALAGEIARQYPDRGRFWFAYDEPLSHLIYAGSDMFLVPSMFEPCGLTQMIAMRYGTVPVVRKTGGLNDTVFDVDDDIERAQASGMEPNGFSFVGADPAGLDYALNRALEMWYTDNEQWQMLTQRVMQQDWSWAEPAFDYVEIYYKALKDR